MNLRTEYEVALAAVTRASLLTRSLQSELAGQAMSKGDRSPVTLADYCSQMLICREISLAFPNDGIIAEEHSQDLLEGKAPGMAEQIVAIARREADPAADLQLAFAWIDHGRDVTSSRQWVLDPIDGTKGFLRGGQFAVALGLMIDGKVVLGMLGCPNLIHDASHSGCILGATLGGGTRQHALDDPLLFRAISTSTVGSGPELSFVESVESGHSDHSTQDLLKDRLGAAQAEPVRIDSQAKYAVVARGEAAVYLRLQSPKTPDYRQKIWDHAAGVLVLTEAGGRATDQFGAELDFSAGATMRNNTGVVATNGVCHDEVIATLQELQK
ncbi:MAG: 3'(2'),5'-bisphosphate nucleotidase [Proteobacteria bacterium]|nr:3'(2'),5'-bisphosphate nucleotidase [Pseudomonadota bacterium]MBU1610905.1 3'(2'),5'-bisphosphate nucleotidase [Pseudomonadota bacterium]